MRRLHFLQNDQCIRPKEEENKEKKAAVASIRAPVEEVQSPRPLEALLAGRDGCAVCDHVRCCRDLFVAGKTGNAGASAGEICLNNEAPGRWFQSYWLAQILSKWQRPNLGFQGLPLATKLD